MTGQTSFIRAAAAALLALGGGLVLAAQEPDPSAALRAADQAMYPDSFSMSAIITTLRPGQNPSSMELEIAHKAGKGSFMELLAPARSKGTRLLQTEGALWMYSPRAGSRLPLRLSPRESFQGSVFSNNDVGDSTWSNDYAPSVAGSAVVNNPDLGAVDCWLVVGKALRRDVPYGELRLYLRKGDLLPLKIEYEAKSGLLLKTMELGQFAMVAGRLRPQRMLMRAADGSGEQSEVEIKDLRERSDLPDAMFNQGWLVR